MHTGGKCVSMLARGGCSASPQSLQSHETGSWACPVVPGSDPMHEDMHQNTGAYRMAECLMMAQMTVGRMPLGLVRPTSA